MSAPVVEMPGINHEEIIRQLELEFAPRIHADDPIHAYVRAFELVTKAGLAQNVELCKVAMHQALLEMRAEMEASGAEKLKAVNDELIRYSQKALKAIKAGRNEANSYILPALVEFQALVNEFKQLNYSNVWRERIVGLLIAVGLVAGGFLLGRLRL